MTPDCCPETRKYQHHITGDISFAARQYLAATGDVNWLFGENYSFPLDVYLLLCISISMFSSSCHYNVLISNPVREFQLSK